MTDPDYDDPEIWASWIGESSRGTSRSTPMSMIAHFRLVEPEVAAVLARYDEDQMADFLFPEDEEEDTTQDIDKSWDGIAYLLTAATGGELTTLLGGSELGPDLGYGPLRYMSPEEVRGTASMLDRIDEEELLKHYAAAEMMAAEVYPEIWDEAGDGLAYIGENFTTVRRLFLSGARRGAALIAWLA